MTFDDYKQAVKADAIEAIRRGDYDYCGDFEQVEEDLWIDDSVTGNGSGSYTFSTAKAQENVKDLLFDEDFIWEAEGMGYTIGGLLDKGPESVDVIARCMALSYVRDEIEEAFEEYLDGNAA